MIGFIKENSEKLKKKNKEKLYKLWVNIRFIFYNYMYSFCFSK